MARFHVVQHGAKHAEPGDPGLTALGHAQAAAAAGRLRDTGVTAVYASPLRRSRETAEVIAVSAGLEVLVDDRLRERMNWDGSIGFDMFLREWARTTADRDHRPPSGDSSRACGERFAEFINAHTGTDDVIVIAGHGGATIDLIRTLAGDDAVPPRLWTNGVPGGAITTIDGRTVSSVASEG